MLVTVWAHIVNIIKWRVSSHVADNITVTRKFILNWITLLGFGKFKNSWEPISDMIQNIFHWLQFSFC